MISHQIGNSFLENYNGVVYCHHDWDYHLHRSFEFITVNSGTLSITVGRDSYEISSGDCIFIPPFVPHSISSSCDSHFFIAVFSGDYVEDVAKLFKSKRADYHKFKLTENTRAYVVEHLCPVCEVADGEDREIPAPKKFMLRSCLYAICSEFLDGATLTKNKKEDSLILEILSYVEDHFLEDITLKNMARSLGYSHEYVSRVFNRTLGFSFKSLVNQYRLEHAIALMRRSEDSLVSVALSSGFQSLRSFNRACRELMGVTPTEIKKMTAEVE